MAATGPGFEEIWAEVGESSLCALINGDRGWLMYLREPGDAGLRSHNASYAGPANAVIEYYLTNGQRDEYPAAWAYPVDVMREALDYFAREKQLPPFIEWHEC